MVRLNKEDLILAKELLDGHALDAEVEELLGKLIKEIATLQLKVDEEVVRFKQCVKVIEVLNMDRKLEQTLSAFSAKDIDSCCKRWSESNKFYDEMISKVTGREYGHE